MVLIGFSVWKVNAYNAVLFAFCPIAGNCLKKRTFPLSNISRPIPQIRPAYPSISPTLSIHSVDAYPRIPSVLAIQSVDAYPRVPSTLPIHSVNAYPRVPSRWTFDLLKTWRSLTTPLRSSFCASAGRRVIARQASLQQPS
jgi:hypothetical protein